MNSFRIGLFFSLPVVVAIANPPASGQVTKAQINDAVSRAAEFVKTEISNGNHSGQTCLAAYALLKAGETPESPAVKKEVDLVLKRTGAPNYEPASNGNYGAGVELMLLEAAGGKKYQKDMQAIVDYLMRHQHATGCWDYNYSGGYDGGDTSQCQYAFLGFWAAERAGIKIPPSVWDRGAQWFLRTQTPGGGFAYHPLGAGKEILHTMTAAGVGSMLLARKQLFPNADDPAKQEVKKETGKFGVLEQVNLDAEPTPGEGGKQLVDVNYQPKVTSAGLLGAANRGSAWLGRWVPFDRLNWRMYYLYTLERMAALLNTDLIGGRDWYQEGAAFLMKDQRKNGSWPSQEEDMVGTSFGILFLTKATAKMLGRKVDLDLLGTGLLAGGRGLPDDLNKAVLKEGKVESTKDLGPLDQLLAELEKVESVDVGAAQQALVEKVQLGDREELIKQKDRVVKLAKHPNVEVRRTAVWALGRTEDLKQAKLLIEALDDNNVDVMVEARNALCIMSRKPLGFGLPETPFDGLAGDATQAQRDAAVADWREKLKARWGAWYYKYRPYQERDDLSEALFQTK